jgi:hypothetical protein
MEISESNNFQEQTASLVPSSENLIISNFISFFEPLISNLDASVNSLR